MPKIVDKPLKRKKIAKLAMELFARDGFENTPIRKITAHAGIGKGTFYDYFTDKDDILHEIVQIMFEDWTEFMIQKIRNTDNPLDQLFTLLKEGATSISSAMATEFETCTPEMTVEELFPIATASPYPIAVIDENEKLLGYIRNHTIIESMIQEEQEEEDV